MEWSWPIFYLSLPIAIAIAYSMFGPVAKSAQNINITDIYGKKPGNKAGLVQELFRQRLSQPLSVFLKLI